MDSRVVTREQVEVAIQNWCDAPHHSKLKVSLRSILTELFPPPFVPKAGQVYAYRSGDNPWEYAQAEKDFAVNAEYYDSGNLRRPLTAEEKGE